MIAMVLTSTAAARVTGARPVRPVVVAVVAVMAVVVVAVVVVLVIMAALPSVIAACGPAVVTKSNSAVTA
jgi:hypothetical protein